MKKASASRLKKLPLLLGTLLIISVAAYGTRAYFSDSAKQQANIELELGDVEISTDKTSDWKYTPLTVGANLDSNKAVNNQLDPKIKSGSIIDVDTTVSNVRPGDSFTREYVIENTGSLDVKVEMNYSGNFNGKISDIKEDSFVVKDGPFIVTIAGMNQKFVLEPKDTEKYTVIVTVDENADNDFNSNDKNPDLGVVTSKIFKEVINIKAVQTNANDISKVQ